MSQNDDLNRFNCVRCGYPSYDHGPSHGATVCSAFLGRDGDAAARVDAAFRLAASVCEDIARRTHDERGGGARIEESAALECRDAILALLGERRRK